MNTPPRISLIISIILLLHSVNVHAQRLEVHPNLDLSTNTISNKVWGVGAAVDLDQWVKNTIFRVNFNWGMSPDRSSTDKTNPRYQKFSGGVSVLYSLKIIEKLTFRCGADLDYTHLRYSHVYGEDTISKPTKLLTWLQTGNFIGIGPHISFQYELTSRFNIALNVIPTYLIPVKATSNIATMESEYRKGLWLFQFQFGVSYKLFKHNQ